LGFPWKYVTAVGSKQLLTGASLWVVEKVGRGTFVYTGTQYHNVTEGRTELAKQYRALHASA